jgi:tRNA dimethylallyltransferase
LVGGTGLYIKAFCDGIHVVPVIDSDIKKNIILNFQASGIGWLQNEIEKSDSLYFKNGEMQNPQRLMRALEVRLSTGKSIIEFQTQKKQKRNFNITKIGLELPKVQLHQNINNRVEEMVRNGLLEEVKSLYPYKHLRALQTVGYRELFDHLESGISLHEAIEKIKVNTRQYAKRQMTWFKKNKQVRWISAINAIAYLNNELQKKF